MKAAVASQRSNVGSAIVAPQQRGASLALRPHVGELMVCGSPISTRILLFGLHKSISPINDWIHSDSKMDYHKCSAARKGCFFSPLFPGFLIFVMRNGKHMPPELPYEEVTDLNLGPWFMEDVPGSSVVSCVVGATFTFDIFSLAPMSSLAKRSRNVSVVDASCFVIQLGVEINSPNANVTCLLLLVMACSSSHETCCANVEDIADITKAKLIDEVMFSFVVNIIAFAGNPSRTTSKGHLAKDKSELVAMCETTSAMSFYNIFRVECTESFRRSQKNMLRVNSGREVGADAKMSVNVSRVKPLLDNSVVAESGISKEGSCCSTKAAIPLLRGLKTCWLWVFLLTILLSSSRAYSDEDTQRSEEGKCRYDLTSIAALSCMQPDGVWRPPSQTCCNALLYAIDQIPGSDEGGACCLCRYMKEKEGLSGLATTYIWCNGKDKAIISKWPTVLIEECSAVCTTNTSGVDMGTSANVYSPVVDIHGPGKSIWIAVAVFSVMALICFWYFRRSKAAIKASEQRRTSSRESEGEARARRRRSKERRFSSS